MQEYLKIKIKSLAAESALIHKTELKHKQISKTAPTEFLFTIAHHREVWLGMASHRRHHIRPIARSALLAYGFMRGRAYRALEAKCYDPPDWPQVAANLRSFCPTLCNSNMDHLLKMLRDWSEIEPQPKPAPAPQPKPDSALAAD